MKSRSYKITYTLTAVLAVLFFILSSLLGGGVATVHAATYAHPKLSFEERNVMEDLQNSTIDGKPFNLKEYSLTTKQNLRVFSFVEYGYSYDPERQSDYDLYVYIYNPQGTKFVYNSVQNNIQFAVGDNVQTYNKYDLKFLNMSTDTNYLGLFLKYKVVLTKAQRSELLDSLNSTERVYVVSSVELLHENAVSATDYAATGVKVDGSECSIIYKYSGYSKGYGVDSETASLEVTQEEGDVLRLEVHHTSYRQKGVTNGKDMYTQDSLTSVYFAVPKIISKKYGYLSEVHAEWRDAITSWGLVTGNNSLYKAIFKYVGQYVGYDNSDIGYSIAYGYTPPHSQLIGMVRAQAEAVFNPDKSVWGSKDDDFVCNFDILIERLNWLFWSGEGADSADSYVVSSATLYDWYVTGFANAVGQDYDGETLDCKNGVKIYKDLFDFVGEMRDYHIKADDSRTLIGQEWTQDFWEKYFTGGYHKDGEAKPSDDIEAIHEVTDNDFLSDKTMTCEKLYISTSDYTNFKDFYDKKKAENNVYLMRLPVTDYISREAVQKKHGVEGFSYECDTNAYFFKQNVFLDFDIIDVTYTNGEVETVIPCVSNPIDIIPEATPPVITTSDKTIWDILKLFLRVLAVILLLVLLMPILPPIFSAIIWVLQLPFKALAKLFHKKE